MRKRFIAATAATVTGWDSAKPGSAPVQRSARITHRLARNEPTQQQQAEQGPRESAWPSASAGRSGIRRGRYLDPSRQGAGEPCGQYSTDRPLLASWGIHQPQAIIYPPTNKELVCLYDDEVEELLIERRRDLIQVTGRVVLDDDSQPKQLIDVTDTRDLDLSGFELASIVTRLVRLEAKIPLVLDVFSDECQVVALDDPTRAHGDRAAMSAACLTHCEALQPN